MIRFVMKDVRDGIAATLDGTTVAALLEKENSLRAKDGASLSFDI
jgi:DNA-binding IscR family transcriptional regulator